MDRIIPAVARVAAAPGALDLRRVTHVSVGDPALLGVAERFGDLVAELAGVSLGPAVVEPAPDGPVIRIDLDGAWPPIRTTGGVRADGGLPGGEAHKVEVGGDRIAVLAAAPEGAHRALTSLLQLAVVGDGTVPCGAFDDAPGLAWRGLSLDVVRTFLPVEVVMRVVDLLSLYKLNVLHLHLTDNEGWRLEVPLWPRLTDVGSTGAVSDRPGGFYTADEFRGLVRYAADRFVTVVPEIDLPGHSQAAISAYPDLGIPGSPNLDPDRDEVWRFVTDVLQVVAELSPAPFVHLGGDEAFGMDHDAHARFVTRAAGIAHSLGRQVVGWQEACRADLGPDDVVQHWIDFGAGSGGELLDSLAGLDLPPEIVAGLVEHFREAELDPARIAAAGVRVLMSPTSHAYLDRPHGDASSRPEQDEARARLGLQVYPPTSLQSLFEWDPLTVLSDVAPGLVAGVEAALWCETVATADDLDLLLLPRLPGVAEVAWSPSPRAAWPAHSARLAAHGALWRATGWDWYRADSVDWPAPLA